ncbi:MAG: helix-turn-helix domain-containing protein [Rubrobacter sp.]|nr:helix-turn-helix domain-containing protein [Rubrobacter sp.]
MSKTLKEWREHRGLSLEELAERIGVTVLMVERWEEIGLDAEPGSPLGDRFIHKIMEALEVEEGLVFPHVPDSPKPGDLVITPGEGMEVEDLMEYAEELDVRVSVPDRFGLSLKPVKGVSEEDFAAIAGHHARERAYSEAVVRRMEAALELLGANSGEWKPGQTVGERLEEADRKLGEDLDRKDGQSPSGGAA